jgi:serine/threonine protein kinase
MFRNYYETGEYDIIILDFDFAWYKGAIEDSILRKPVGYLAPEQVFLNDKVSARSTLIDSYSLGMLFYYMVSCSEPLFNSHLNSDWERKVYDACKSKLKSTWRSISFRFQRLILNLTKDRQNERWDVSQANSEITRLLDAEKNEKSVFAELVAEELISRMLVDQNYSCLNNEFLYNYVNGVTLRISYNEVRKAVGLTIGYQTTGVENFSNIKRYLPQRKEKTLAILKKNEWKINSDNKTSENFTINAEIDTHILLANFNNNIKDLSQIKLEYNFN